MTENKICCLIPAYNEAERITSVIKGAKNTSGILSLLTTDQRIHQQNSRKKRCTRGQTQDKLRERQALRTGSTQAQKMDYHTLVTLDIDGQHDPAEIQSFLNRDIIIGSRLWDKAAVPLYRYIPNQIGIFCISKAAGCKIEDTQSGFRLHRKEVLDKINLETTGFETETEILIKAGKKGFSIQSLPVSAIYQSDYTTNFRPVRDFYRISILVLKLAFWGGD